MAMNVTQKILAAHLVSGTLEAGSPIAIRIDQTLTQDATGTMAYLQFEALGLPRVRTELSVSYVDHNMLQSGFENADDHRFLQSFAAKYGVHFSRPGNGICHQVHLERFSRPGGTLLGSDSHTPTSGGAGMLAIGAGGLDIALAMGGLPFNLNMPQVVGVKLTGRLQPFVSAKDIILEVLRHKTVKGGVGKVFEYFGPGVAHLSVPERATITNMGAELGATTSVFPSDAVTRRYLAAQGRDAFWSEWVADADADYDEVLEIDLDQLEPLIACPHSPDNVRKVREVAGTPVAQVAIGSCTNSSYTDLMTVASMLKGKVVADGVSLGVSPGSRQVMEMVTRDGGLLDFIGAGSRILESACGPCIGMGFAPPTEGVSVRSFNRNFYGRSGTKNAAVYLASPETCAACALTGVITDPRDLGLAPIHVPVPERFLVDDRMVLAPAAEGSPVDIIRGPNIAKLPTGQAAPASLQGEVLIRLEDDITTDHIMPAGAKVLPLRSNLPAISEFVFHMVDETFPARAKAAGGGFIVAGHNYGQGSSREHAALAPRYLGVRAVLVKSFARIHLANLVNFGILPLTFVDAADYAKVQAGDRLSLELGGLALNKALTLRDETGGFEISVMPQLASARDLELILKGGALSWAREQLEKVS
ncbi:MULTISPECIES: aconitate hydratase [Acidithiobacillus]|jgi:aconitate hydratase|uniref:Aconitate hydratase A n=6 Tax=Acidithiobacillus TaxID=119977 RepID=B7J4G6_ACIF2|nr:MULTISPECIES: aconitate hydratase [Acidithiobacillus]MCL5956897.1 aconitate hydratase [Gammaproteobacteria bacterium]ACH82839.1 aconitate hydratase [Acidithiobacillus ferrooxidans ATCC 53993]ACK78148.1 aconitate hydratase, putative [Acidithiobacillus ferrooxidans ATCC 23270]MBN6748832.1 aconitate hydratase [Acidithiobacillus sp. PG05]MBU2775559.1 aconitate hydratase [Acidithiobacillus ferrooxidans]